MRRQAVLLTAIALLGAREAYPIDLFDTPTEKLWKGIESNNAKKVQEALAVQKDKPDLTKAYMKADKPYFFCTPLMAAAEKNETEIVSLMIEAKIDVNVVIDRNYNWARELFEKLKYDEEKGRIMDQRINKTALNVALQAKSKEVAILLISNKAN